MASQLESTSVKVVSESTVFENPRNSAEKVTLVELEVDHSCTWEKALELAGSQEGLCGFFMPKKCRSQIFLALPIDALRLRLASPQRLYAGQLPTASLVAGFLKYGLDEASQAHAKKAWESRHAVATSKEQHLERFALLNGAVFSTWHNLRDALDPNFDPDEAQQRTEQERDVDSRGRGHFGRAHRRVYHPNVKIQLLTSSDGKKLGGIRLSVHRPKVHAASSRNWGPDCNKCKWGHAAYCRKQACMVEGPSQVDKLKKSIEVHTRQLW